MAKKLTKNKAREILHDKSVHGHPLTDKQRKFFGAIASAQNGIEGTMGGLTDKGFNYNPAWGGAWENGGWMDKYEDGGTLQPPMAGANQSVPMYAMGGSLPGMTGNMYARIGAPSNGKYAKKTLSSAQNGKEMSFYQAGLDFEPKTISENGGWLDKYADGGEVTPCYDKQGNIIPCGPILTQELAPIQDESFLSFPNKISTSNQSEFNYKDYYDKANSYLTRPIFKGTTLSGKDIADAAEEFYKKNKYVYPLDLLLTQGQIETQLGKKLKSRNNFFNIGNTDIGDTRDFKSPKDSVYSYMDLMYKDYLLGGKKTPEELLAPKGFVNYAGNRYASAPNYETELSGQRDFIRKNYFEDGGEIPTAQPGINLPGYAKAYLAGNQGDMSKPSAQKFAEQKRIEEENKKMAAYNAANQARTYVAPTKQLTPYEEQKHQEFRRNQLEQYAATHPEQKLNEFGDLTLSPYGEFVQKYGDNMDKFAESWETPLAIEGLISGAPLLARGLASGARATGQYLTTKTPLRNAYKLNPWAFKPNPEAYYRMLGKEGYADALESGILRAKPNGDYTKPYFSLGRPLDVRDIHNISAYEGPYMAEVRNKSFIDPYEYLGGGKTGIGVPEEILNINDKNVSLYKQNWLKGYKPVEVPKPITGTLPPPQQSGFPNPLAVADAIVPRINPFSFIEDGGDLMSMSPLNFVPGYGKTLGNKKQAFRKFGNSIQDVIKRQALSPKGGSPLRIGKSQIVSEGNWAAPDRPWEKYPGVFEATFDFTHPERNIAMRGDRNRGGVLITDKQGNLLPDIPLTEPGMSFNRRLPFSNRYVPINKQKLINNQFQLATFAPHLQSLAEKYAVGLGGATTLGAMGYPGAVETYNKYTIDPLKEQWKNFQNTDIYKKGKELDQSIGLDFSYDKKKQGGVVKDDMGYWNPENWGKVVEIGSNNITMEEVDQPLVGISDKGDVQYMEPGKNYKFKGKKVTEYPVGKQGVSVNKADEYSLEKLDNLLNFTNYNKKAKSGGWLDKYQ